MVEEFILERIMTRIDQLDEKIERATKVEITVSNHLEHVTEGAAKKEKRFYIIIAGLGTIFASVTLVQTII